MDRKPYAAMGISLAIVAAAAVGLCLATAGLGTPAAREKWAETAARPAVARRPSGKPPVILWAWERPEDLRFIDPRKVGVAFLAETLRLHGEEVLLRPRLQPLRTPEGTWLVAVTRIEADRSQPPTLSAEQREQAAAAIADLQNIPGVSAIQVDFDATTSERVFYRALLNDLRRRLPIEMPLSITALTSWCLGDDWLAGVPVDEAVPMLFRMGPDAREVRRHLENGGDFRTPACRQSTGISTDEIAPPLPPGRRVYVFHPQPWSAAAVTKALEGVRP